MRGPARGAPDPRFAAALFTGAGLSRAPPSSLPLAPAFHRMVDAACYEAARRLAPGLLGPDAFEAVLKGPWNLLARLESTLPGAGAGALSCMRVTVPNEAHLLAALHLAHGGLHVTVNVDDGVEVAYALLAGEAELPAQAPAGCRAAVATWRSCFPRPAPALQILAAPERFDTAALAARALLVKLHGSVGRHPDGVVLPLTQVAEDVDVTELGRNRRAAIDALAAEPFVVVTGYSGSDLASYSALLTRLEPGRFSWVAPMVRPEVHSVLRAMDPGQPVAGRAVDVIRDILPVRPPRWPSRRLAGPGFEERFAAWSAELPLDAAAEAFAWALSDADRHEEAVAFLERLAAHASHRRTRMRLADALARRGQPGDEETAARTFLRTAVTRTDTPLRTYALARWAECGAHDGNRATAGLVAAAAAAAVARRRRDSAARTVAASAVVGILVSRIERRLATALRSTPRRLVLRAVADVAARQAARALARTTHAPSGRRRALLRRQEVELAAIVALLGGRPTPPDALRSLRLLSRKYEHLGDSRGRAGAIATRALVWLAAGRPSRALRAFQEASRLQPASVGVLATVRDLLDLSGHGGDLMDGGAETTTGRQSSRTRLTDDGDRSAALATFVRALPKVELHVHLEGSVAPSTLAALARRNGDRRLPWTVEDVRRWYRFRSYTDFLNAYVLVCDQLRTAGDFARVTEELGQMLAGENVRYAEVTFSPVAHMLRGIPAEDLFAGLEHGRHRAEARCGIRLRWCAASGTRRGPAAAIETIELVLTHQPRAVVSFGLAGHESAVPRAHFAPAFALARDTGLHRVAHAGEAAGPASVWEAIDVLGAERIGHGIRSLEDPALVARLREAATPLEVCPTSNVRTGVVPSFRAHPLPRLLAEGLDVNLNTDDPAMFRTHLNAEYLTAACTFGLAPSALAEVARSGVRAAFLAREDADALLAEIDSVPVPDELVASGRRS